MRNDGGAHETREPGLFADAKLNGVEFERVPVSVASEREAFWRAVSAACKKAPSGL
jgi:hypothetical protein